MKANIKNTNINFSSREKIKKSQNKPKFTLKLRPDKQKKENKEKSNKSFLQSFLSREKKILLPKKKKLEILYTFANQLLILLESGVPLSPSLAILSEQTENINFKSVVDRITQDINAGESFTHALSKYPDIFPNLFVAMIRAAEKGGQLANVLKQLAAYLEEQDKFSKKLRSAMAYPKFVLSFFLVVLLTIIFGLVPKFEAIFKSFNTDLPKPTQILINISNFATNYIIWEAVTIFLFVVFLKRFKKTDYGRFFLDSLKLKLPVVGDILLKSTLSKFCRTLSILIQSGISIVESLTIAATTAQNVPIIEALKTVKQGVIEGEPIHKKLSQNPIFPSLVVKMIATGEESGALDKMLVNISVNYDTNVDTKISTLSSIIEPAMMVALGAVALVTVICFYLPIFKTGSVIQ